MRRIVCILLISVFAICQFASAETLTIDLETASYDEICYAIEILNNARKEYIINELEETPLVQPVSGIMFRGVPWLTTKESVLSLFGKPRSNYVDYVHNVKGQVYTNGIGSYGLYTNDLFTVCGYIPSSTELNFVSPVVDGVLVEDQDTQLFILADYSFSPADFGDVEAIAEEMKNKLSQLYGEYTIVGTDYVWSDNDGNVVKVQYSNWLHIIYYYAGTEELLQAADRAMDEKLAAQEEIIRLQNQGNFDGL